MASVRLLCGAARSGRTEAVNELVRACWGHVLLLVPTRRYAARRMEELIFGSELQGAWGCPVVTLNDFVVDLLKGEGRCPLVLDDLERRIFLENTVARLRAGGRLDVLGPVVDTTGFVQQVLGVVTELKQAAIEPAVFRRQVITRSQSSIFDGVVADVYEGYQEALQAADAYDLPGLFWAADLICRRGRPRVLERVRGLFLDGFDDFTPSEFQLLASLEPYLEELTFGLNCSADPNQVDLYALPLRTAHLIHQRFDVPPVFFEEPLPVSYTEWAAASLFWRDRPLMPGGLYPNLRIIPCPDAMQEMEIIGRRIKTLVVDEGVSLDSIAVVYRSMQDVAGPLRAVLAEMGIPACFGTRPRLWDSAVGAFVLTLLEAMRSWRREVVVEVLMSPWYGGEDIHRALFPYLSCVARVIGGLDEWRCRLQALRVAVVEPCDREMASLLWRMPEAVHAIDQLSARVEALAVISKKIPQRGTAAAFAAALEDVLESMALEGAVNAHPSAMIRAYEMAALSTLRRLLAHWRMWADPAEILLDRAACVSRLRRALQETLFDVPQPNVGVVCFDLASIRHLRFDHVFFAGANEGQVPQPPHRNAVYSDEDVDQLARVGVELENRLGHSKREALLFHHILPVARKTLTITWRKIDRQGRGQYASPYVYDLLDLFAEVSIQEPCRQVAAFVPALEECASWRDLRNYVFLSSAAESDLLRDRFAAVYLGSQIERDRDSKNPFGPYDGVLSDPAIIASIAAGYGVNHRFSVNQVELYLGCPFRFFAERILKVEATDLPVAEFDAKLRGTILHAVLQHFFEHYRGVVLGDIDFEGAVSVLDGIVEEVFRRRAWRSITMPLGVDEVEKRRMQIQMARHVRFELGRRDLQWSPSHFEVSFGDEVGTEPDPLSCLEPFSLDTPTGPVLFAGRIDRIDQQERSMRIIDYKSTVTVSQGDVADGTAIQLAVYALALEQLLMPGMVCAEAAFVQVGGKTWLEVLKRKGGVWEARRDAAMAQTACAVVGIREGHFPPVPRGSTCQYCDVRQACRYSAGRIGRREEEMEDA